MLYAVLLGTVCYSSSILGCQLVLCFVDLLPNSSVVIEQLEHMILGGYLLLIEMLCSVCGARSKKKSYPAKVHVPS